MGAFIHANVGRQKDGLRLFIGVMVLCVDVTFSPTGCFFAKRIGDERIGRR